MLVITYDEHGGFFDHVPPLSVPATILGQNIATTGVRVPSFVVSPYVYPGSVFKGALDHTSILQLLDDRFGGGPGYSAPVNQRQMHLDRLQNTVTGPRIGNAPQITPSQTPIVPLPAAVTPTSPNTPNALALHRAAKKLADEYPDLIRNPNWNHLRQYLGSTP